LLVLLMPPAASAQAPPAGQHARDEVLAAARDVVEKARYCTFITNGRNGHPQARIVDPLPPDGGFNIWFATNPLTRKVSEIRRDPRVSLLCFDTATSSYVTVLGRGALVSGAVEQQQHWKADWTRIYPAGPGSPDVVLIRVTPLRLEIVSESRGMIGDSKTWLPLAIDFPRK